MAVDDDLAGLLPEAPPPRPDRRVATIVEAMQRYDGEEPRQGKSVPPAVTGTTRRSWIGGPQMAIAMSIAVVAVVGLPVALNVIRETVPAAGERTPARAEEVTSAPVTTGMSAASQPVLPADRGAQPAASDAATSRLAGRAPAQEPADKATDDRTDMKAQGPASSQQAAPAAFEPAKLAGASEAESVRAENAGREEGMMAARARAPSRVAAAPVTMATEAEAEDDDGAENIVVTGSRRSAAASAAARRGDWNACTVKDPEERFDGCGRLINRNGRGEAGQAAIRVADGVKLAWHGDDRGAIAAFDEAITLRPRYAFAYLNRGLVYQNRGDETRAITEFNLAIRHAPYEASGYYHRSVVLRQQGKIRQARADEAKALQLDPRYDALIE